MSAVLDWLSSVQQARSACVHTPTRSSCCASTPPPLLRGCVPQHLPARTRCRACRQGGRRTRADTRRRNAPSWLYFGVHCLTLCPDFDNLRGAVSVPSGHSSQLVLAALAYHGGTGGSACVSQDDHTQTHTHRAHISLSFFSSRLLARVCNNRGGGMCATRRWWCFAGAPHPGCANASASANASQG